MSTRLARSRRSRGVAAVPLAGFLARPWRLWRRRGGLRVLLAVLAGCVVGLREPAQASEVSSQPLVAQAKPITSGGTPRPEPGSVEERRRARAEQTERFKDAVVVIWNTTEREHWLGSGFFIDDRGTVLTNQHVVGRARVVVIATRSGKIVPARVVATREDLDLAILSSGLTGVPWLPLAATTGAADVAGEAWVIGAPRDLFWSLNVGAVSAVRAGEGALRWVQTDAAVNKGNSGGPVILVECGYAIGVATLFFSQAQGLNFAVSSDTVRRAFPQYVPREPGRCEGAQAATVQRGSSSPGAGPVPGETRPTLTVRADAPVQPRAAAGIRPATGTVLAKAATTSGRGEIAVSNLLREDAIVTLRELGGKADPYLAVYVRARDRVTLLELKTGEFELEYVVGRGWTGQGFAETLDTYKLRQPLSIEDVPVVIRDARGTRTTQVPGAGWTVILKQESLAVGGERGGRRR